MLFHCMVVQHGTQIEVGKGQLQAYSVIQGAIWSTSYINVKEGEVAI